MSRRRSIALVHQERNILTSLAIAFESAGFDVTTYTDGRAAFEALSIGPADIAILGRRMPGLYGPDLFRKLRQLNDMPVIFLSSYGAELADEVPGADDYLAVGCSAHLLVERANLILRGGVGDLMLDPVRRRCTWRGERLYLNMPEFLILELLASKGVHTRFALMEAAYGLDMEMDEKLIDGHVEAIERKCRGIDPAAKLIKRVGGVAYRLREPVAASARLA